MVAAVVRSRCSDHEPTEGSFARNRRVKFTSLSRADRPVPCFMLLNLRSLKFKCLLVHDALTPRDIDVFILAETWLIA